MKLLFREVFVGHMNEAAGMKQTRVRHLVRDRPQQPAGISHS